LSVPEIDKLLGIEAYATKTSGVGGAIREEVDDFVVEEVLVDGSKANVNGAVPSKVLASTPQKQRVLLCVLVKRNWDTFVAVKNVAKSLGVEQGHVQFAGIKDAKAVTAQFITLENVSIDDAKKISVKDVAVYPIGYVREQLALFYLLGNHFTITIKHLKKPKEIIEKQVAQTLLELDAVGGIPNFFGHQRFGTTRPITHLVGKALAQGDFEGAAMLFLAKPSVHEHPASRRVRQELAESGNFKQASESFPKQLRFERLMLSHLAENSSDFVGAFKRLPVKLLALFVQAHQSYLFNRFLSERIKHKLPLNEAVVGDFVVGVERSGLPLTSMVKMAAVENLNEINAQVAAGRLRVALPVFGVKQKLSEGAMGALEKEVLSQEGVEPDKLRFNTVSRVGGKGGLRAVVAPIRDFKLQSVSEGANGEDCQVKLSFMLLRGCYATVLLRELMKPSDLIAAGF
jgi:tRNA pseudouridine13 synthase